MQSPEIKANITPLEGKTCLVTGATSGIGKVTGKYFVKRAPVQSSATSYNTEMAQKLWEISEGLTGLN
jgi:NAD(P)-dependent dehydrogenase (short-subunit alcohol dehydrogenase family)